MSLQQLSQEIDAVRLRALRFQERHASVMDSTEPLLVEIVDELNATLEKLQVAEEELVQQNEELAQARQQAESEQHRYEDLFEFAPDAYLITDPFGVIHEANKAAYQLLEVTPGRLLGRPLTSFFHANTRRNLRTIITHMAGRDKPQTWEYFLSTGKGRRFAAELTGVPALDEAGQVAAVRWLVRDVTVRRTAEERLRSSEARLAEAQRLAHLGHWEWDLDQEVILWSDELYRIYGLEPQSVPITADYVLQHFHPADREQATRLLETTRQLAQPFTFEHRIVRADGAIRTVQTRCQVVRNELEQVVRLLGTSQDVTERKEVEEQVRQLNNQLEQRVADRTRELGQTNADLHDSQHRLKAIFEQSLDMIVLVDDAGRYVDVNPAAETLTDFTRTELLGLKMYDLITEGNSSEVWHAFLQAGSQRGEYTIRRKDGTNRQVEFRAVANVLPGLHLSVIRDITKRIKAEAALRENEERFRVMANLAPTIVWTAAPDGTITYANQQWLEYCGILAEQNVTQWPELVLHPDDSEYCLRQWNRALREGTEYEVEVRYQRYDGEYRWFLTRAVPTRDASGHITAWVGTTTDIHDHRMAEESIRQLNQELDQRVEELETLLNVLPIGIAVAHDPEFREITMNPAFTQILGLPVGENPSKPRPASDAMPFKVLRDGQEVPSSELPMKYAATHDVQLREVELDLVRADGTQVSVLEYASPLYDEHDRVRGCLGVLVDITPRKVVERRLALQYAVAHALAESIGVSEASVKVLQAVCEITSAEFGALWRVDWATGRLRSESTWQAPLLNINGFAGVTRSTSFEQDQGLPGRVVSSGRPVWIPDMATSGLPRSDIAERHGLHSAFAVPIRSEGEITGVLECFSRTVREPDAELIEQLDAIGHQVGLFMERKQAEDDLAVRAHQQAILAEVGQRALAGIPLQELLDEIVGHVSLTLGVGFCGLLEMQSNPDRLVMRAGIGWKNRAESYIVSSGLDSAAGYTLAMNEPLVFSDLNSDPRFPASHMLHEHHVVSGVGVKIPGKDRPFGALGAFSTRPRIFSEDDVHFLQAVAHVVALAVERWRAEEALQLSRAEIATILDSMADGISALNKEGQRVYANQALVRLLRLGSLSELQALPSMEHPRQFDILDEEGQPLARDLFPSLRALQGQPTEGLVVRYKFHTTGEEMWAMLKSRPVYNEAGEVVMAVSIVQDISALKRTELAQRLLAETGALLSKALDYKTRLDELARLVVPRLADWCAIDLLDEQGILQPAVVVHVDPAKADWAWELRRRYPPNPEASTGSYEAIRTGQPQFLFHITPEVYANITDPELLEVLRQLDLNSSMIVPLTARGRSLGVMTFIWAESGYHYTPADLELAQELAHRAALALDNARLYDEAQRLNVELEQRVLQRTGELQAANIQLNAEITERRQAEEQIRGLNAELEERVRQRTQQLEVINYDLQHEIMERKQAEKALRLALQRTRELYTLSQHISLARSSEEVLQILLSSSYLRYTVRTSVAIFDAIWQDDEIPPGGCTILAAWNRDPDVPLYIGQHMTLEEYGLVPPFSHREVLFINDIRNDSRVSEAMRQRLLGAHTASSLLFPLIASGEWYGMLSIHFRFVDIVNAEDILHLRGLVDEAAMAIYNFQLLENEAHARREAELANSLKMKFLAMISHELRTPLASIKGFASTLLAEDVLWQPDRQREFIATIDSEADKLVDLIEQLLDLSRLEAGTMRIAPHAENWERILASAEAQLQALTTQHHFSIQLPPHLSPVKADSRRIAQVITNLVSNAVKYSPPQSNITLTVMPYSAGEAKVSVSDEGAGIPPEYHARVFEAFQQLQHGRSDFSGAGLGLAICRGLIEAHGGRIWVDEHEGPGATLSFTLPLA